MRRKILSAGYSDKDTVEVIYWNPACASCDGPTTIEAIRMPKKDLRDAEPELLAALAPCRRGLPFKGSLFWAQPLWDRKGLAEFIRSHITELAKTVKDYPDMLDEYGVEVLADELTEQLEVYLAGCPVSGL